MKGFVFLRVKSPEHGKLDVTGRVRLKQINTSEKLLLIRSFLRGVNLNELERDLLTLCMHGEEPWPDEPEKEA